MNSSSNRSRLPRRKRWQTTLHCLRLLLAALLALTATASKALTVVIPVEVTSTLPAGTIPMDVEVDFAAILAKAKLPGVFDPNTVEVTNLATGAREPHALSPHVAYGDRARVRWLVKNPAEKKFEIRFRSATQRPVLRPRPDTPLIGVGDLLRYTGPQPRPIASSLATRLVDLNGDGVRDLVATDYYTSEPLWPERIPDSWSPFLCFPGVQDDGRSIAAVRECGAPALSRQGRRARPVLHRRLHAHGCG